MLLSFVGHLTQAVQPTIKLHESQAHLMSLRLSFQRATPCTCHSNIKDLGSTNFCGGCFEFLEISAKAPQNGEKKYSAKFSLVELFWVDLAEKCFLFGILLGRVFVFGLLLGAALCHSFRCFRKGPGVPWTLGLQSIPPQAHKCASVGLWDCSPQHRHADQQSSAPDDSCLPVLPHTTNSSCPGLWRAEGFIAKAQGRPPTGTNKCTLSESEARRATKKRDAPCCKSVLKSEGGAVFVLRRACSWKKNCVSFCGVLSSHLAWGFK